MLTSGTIDRVVSPQTLSLADRRIVAGWAAQRAERVLSVFELAAPEDAPADLLPGRTRLPEATSTSPGRFGVASSVVKPRAR